MKTYTVTVHYQGAVDFEIEADSEQKARELAEKQFDNMEDRYLGMNLWSVESEIQTDDL